jgi:hypothetical protein
MPLVPENLPKNGSQIEQKKKAKTGSIHNPTNIQNQTLFWTPKRIQKELKIAMPGQRLLYPEIWTKRLGPRWRKIAPRWLKIAPS